MGRPSKQDYRYHDDGNVALYRRPNSAMWYARCKLEDGTALNPFSTGAEDEAEAVKAARKRIMFAQVDQERGLDPGGKTFAFIAEQWLKMMRKEVEKKISTKAKVDAYEAITRRYHIPYFNKTKITEITPKSLAAYETWRAEYWTSGPGAVAEFETITRKDGKIYKRKTKRVARGKMDAEDTVLRQIFKFAVKEEYLPVARMPTIGSKKQVGNGTQSSRRPAFTKEQAGKLLDYDANAFYPITAKMDAATVARLEDDRMVFKAWLALMLGTGIRPGKEHHGIKWKHFEQHDDENGKNHLYLTVQKDTKTGSRNVHVDTETYAIFLGTYKAFPSRDSEIFMQGPVYGTKFKAPDDYVLCDQETGKPILRFDRQFHTMLRNLKMEHDDNGDAFTPYSLRHTWATLKLNAGMNERLVALNLGTSPEMVHRHYGHDNTKSRASEFADEWLGKEE
ncbi:tyrosine-type recombinase/integrase [Magnetospirillum sp. 15-1]|uniref:tyrosine-type recombinase/integrase n=1 Tax=Magnetospirillum sp. 15-1 TaxID=1979370 RepID=UPI000BBCBD68|nr:tyrosine-type recombinase/integrase [Magnetospirillum sp. 15-1]